jgi:iron complex transport system substrate-binding protein
MLMLSRLVLIVSAVLGLTGVAWAQVMVVDDLGRSVVLAHPAERIISLAPHATELLFDVGAGGRVVGVSQGSDYPPAATRIPRVGGASGLDIERIVQLRPDLVVAWASGNSRLAVERLIDMGIPVYFSEPRRLEDVATSLERLGRLAGTESVAYAAAHAFNSRLQQLRAQYAHRATVTVFYEIWNSPLLTVNGEHMISHVIELCGGRNVFADVPVLTPQVGVEAVLARDPQAIVASAIGGRRPPWLDDWRRWPWLAAVRSGNLYFIDSDLMNRQTPRILDGAERLCGQLEAARRGR